MGFLLFLRALRLFVVLFFFLKAIADEFDAEGGNLAISGLIARLFATRDGDDCGFLPAISDGVARDDNASLRRAIGGDIAENIARLLGRAVVPQMGGGQRLIFIQLAVLVLEHGIEKGDALARDEDLQCLEAFAVIDKRAARVVELRFFGGLTLKETAEALSVNAATVKRDWIYAKSWLFTQLNLP